MLVRREVDAQIEVIASQQAGAFRMDDVLSAGGDRFLAKRRVDAGRWLRRPGGCFALVGAPATLDQERHLALLAAGPAAVLSHESAAELHGLDGVQRGRVVLSIPEASRLILPSALLHRVDDLRAEDRTSVATFPTTTVARTLLDLGSVTSFLRLRRATEHALVDRLVTYAQVGSTLAAIRRRGKPGVRLLVRVLDSLDGQPPPASHLERQLRSVIALAGVPAAAQYPLPWHREPVVGCVDFAVPASRLLLEADGRAWHARHDAMERDRRRDRAALLAGWATLRFMHRDLVHAPEDAAADIAALHRRRLAA